MPDDRHQGLAAPGSSAPSNSLALAPGTRFGSYEILSPLGAGGMGEVYRAKDVRLGREVAIKVLTRELSSDQQRLARFQQEARSASTLNHPNIVTIYELGEAEHVHYISMEVVKGKTLRERLRSGPIPVRETIQIAAQVAEGLANAHEIGIVHRDLKPENLMVCEGGLVKILDFGIAKLIIGSAEQSALCTMADSPTYPGHIVGTVEYMSPEQASGRPLDFRSDQFSLGVVLYEMLTSRQAFRRNTAAETLVAILRDDPEPLTPQNSDIPAPLLWIIERCLAKEPEKRYGSTRDLARDLAGIRDRVSDLTATRVERHASKLPAQRTAFVGREKEIAGAKQLLVRDDVRLVTVTGPGGIGKTRLALQVANELSDVFPGGIYFVSLATVREADIVPTIIQTLVVRQNAGHTPMETLKKHFECSSVRTMLLLDNFEHLVASAPIVSEILGAALNLKILVTSRAALHIYGEHEFPVPALALPDSQALSSIEALVRCPAVALFRERAVAVKPDFEITQDNASAVAEICARLDGLPLAIELAAARIKLLAPAAMQTRLASRLRLLTGGAKDLPTRQQTLRGAIDWSYELLNPAEQKLFRRLSIFVGGCTLEAIEAVCDVKNDLATDVLDAVASIVDKSLIQQVERTGGESRFLMLETIREYALEKLVASGEDELIKRAHSAYYLVLAEEGAAGESATGAGTMGSLDEFELEHDNLLTALDWLIDAQKADWGLRLGTAMFRFWETKEYLSEGRSRLEKLLQLPAAELPTRLRQRALFAAGVLTGRQGDYESADTLFRQSMQIARSLEDRQGIAVSLNALAVDARDRSDLETARSLFEEALAVWREEGGAAAVARALSNLANIIKLQGNYSQARALYGECLAIFRQLGDNTGLAWSLNYLGDVACGQGDMSAAKSLYEQSLATFRDLGNLWGMAASLADLGNLARDQGDYKAARILYRESIKVFQQLGHKRGMAHVLECFACLTATEDATQSLKLAGAAAAVRKLLGAPLTSAEQAKFEEAVEPARRALSTTAGQTAWLEGWAMPLDTAVREALKADSASA
ncbi:MAG TPA: protein kinase [Terriglobales bacterium]|nr:protein kinase [Terriglobales bacterium]